MACELAARAEYYPNMNVLEHRYGDLCCSFRYLLQPKHLTAIHFESVLVLVSMTLYFHVPGTSCVDAR